MQQLCYNTNTIKQGVLKRGLYYETYSNEEN